MYEPKIIAFLCTWCSYTGADLAGTSRFKSPHNIRAIRVPCSGRVSPELVMKAFDQGADGVLVLGCHIGECHYDNGNHRAAKRVPLLHSLLTYTGLDSQRLRLDWVSASEGERFSHLVNEFVEVVRALGPVNWRISKEQLSFNSDHWIPEMEYSVKEELLDSEHWSRRTEAIRDTARDLLSTGEASCVIGYEVGSRGRTRPIFIYKPDDVERLVWNQSCTHNLTTYLKGKLTKDREPDTNSKHKVAIVVKSCDSKSINVLLGESRISRDQVHIIGVVCDGIREEASLGEVNGRYQHRCLTCKEQMPVVYDTIIGETPSRPVVHSYNSILSRLDEMSTGDRMEFWLSQFDRCIRCYACRQACPVCDCPTCLYERDDSLWAGMNIEINEKRTFHLGRAYHLAGRCVGCDECQRVCPMDIPVSLLNRKLAQEVEAAFGYRAGITQAPSPITTPLIEEAKA